MHKKLSEEVKRVLIRSAGAAHALGKSSIGSNHILWSILRGDDGAAGLPIVGQVMAPHLTSAQISSDWPEIFPDDGSGVVGYTEEAARCIQHAHGVRISRDETRMTPAMLMLGLLREQGSMSHQIVSLSTLQSPELFAERIDQIMNGSLPAETNVVITGDPDDQGLYIRIGPYDLGDDQLQTDYAAVLRRVESAA